MFCTSWSCQLISMTEKRLDENHPRLCSQRRHLSRGMETSSMVGKSLFERLEYVLRGWWIVSWKKVGYHQWWYSQRRACENGMIGVSWKTLGVMNSWRSDCSSVTPLGPDFRSQRATRHFVRPASCEAASVSTERHGKTRHQMRTKGVRCGFWRGNMVNGNVRILKWRYCTI